jgi:L-lysine exporter family protein LysE/ArgO
VKYFLQGLTMGLAYVAPIGLQNLFVINSALTHTRKRALLTALIVILFDVTLALASCLWFTGLTLLISLFSDNFTPKTLVVINKVCGVIIVFYGCKLLYSFLTMVF